MQASVQRRQPQVFRIDQRTACTSLLPDTLPVLSLEPGTQASTQQACQFSVFMIGQQESLCNAPSLTFEHGQTFLVNTAGKRTQLQRKGEHLLLEACPFQHGLSTSCKSSLSDMIGLLSEDKEIHDQSVASRSSSSTDLDEDKRSQEEEAERDSLNFQCHSVSPKASHVHDQSSFACLICGEKAVVSGGELSHNSFHPFHEQQPTQLSCKETQLHHKHPRSYLHRSVELQEAKGGASEKKLQHVLSSTCVYDLPDLAWTEPACVFRGHLPTSQLPAKKSGQSMTNKLAAQQGTRHSELQVDTGPESLTALSTVVSVGHSASFGGTSLGAPMVQQSVPRQLPAFNLAYEENFKELVKEEAKTNLPQLSPVTSLNLNSLQLQSVDECLSLTLRSLSKMLSALLVSLIQYTNLRFQLQSLQQQELARSAWATDSLQQKELVKSTAKSLQLSPTRACELQLSHAQLCRQKSSHELSAYNCAALLVSSKQIRELTAEELANLALAQIFPAMPDEGNPASELSAYHCAALLSQPGTFCRSA